VGGACKQRGAYEWGREELGMIWARETWAHKDKRVHTRGGVRMGGGVCAQVEGCMHGSRGARMDREGYV
jgi:hypothetical protein